MRLKLLFFAVLTTAFAIQAQIKSGFINDFQDGTTQGWQIGKATGAPTNMANAGPNGTTDNALQFVADGSGQAGKMVIFNTSNDWKGNYTTAGIKTIRFSANVSSTLNLRVAFDGIGGRFCTTNAVTISPSDGWVEVIIPIEASNFTAVGGTNISSTLSNVSTFRLLSNSSPSWRGEQISATLKLDNITASASTLSTSNTGNFITKIIPNPATSYININFDASIIGKKAVTIYNVLGKKITNLSIDQNTSRVDVSYLTPGLYLLKVTSGTKQSVKKFIKE